MLDLCSGIPPRKGDLIPTTWVLFPLSPSVPLPCILQLSGVCEMIGKNYTNTPEAIPATLEAGGEGSIRTKV